MNYIFYDLFYRNFKNLWSFCFVYFLMCAYRYVSRWPFNHFRLT